MKLVILAGGKGTRLGFTHIPKPMVEIGGKPLLQHQIELAKRYGIKDVFILSGYLAEVIFNHFKDGKAFGVNITHIIEPYPLGTAGSLKLIEHLVKDERFLLFYGDVMMDFDIKGLLKFDREKRGIATIVVHPNDHPHDSDLIELDRDGFVKAFYPKPHEPERYYKNLVSAAVYVLSKEIFKYIENCKFQDFGKDIFPFLLKKGEKIAGYRTCEYIKDMGTKKRLEEVSEDFEKGKVAILNKKNKRKAIFLDRDGVLNEEVNLLHKPEDLKLISGVGSAIRKINKSTYLAVVITNQPVVARNLCSIDELDTIHKKLETLLGRDGAYLDGIYYCPHHPDKGYDGENPEFKIDCNCRKPKIGLVMEAKKELNIDFNGSFFIGDTERDILCGKNAGLTTIGLRTGYGCKNIKTEPDYFFDTLHDAVRFIVDEPYSKYFSMIKEKFGKSSKKPFIILVGGNTRSGKTTFSRYIQKRLDEEGIKSMPINLDNWLLPAEERKETMDVFQRFQTERIESDLKRLLKGEKITLKRYNPFCRGYDTTVVNYSIGDRDVIIIDGVVALGIDYLLKKADLRIFFDIDDKTLMHRLHTFYSWKGLSKVEIDDITKKRKIDEYDIIKSHITYADIVLREEEL